MNINELLENAKELTCYEEEWQKAYDALYNLSWEKATKHPRAAEWAYWYASNIIKGRWAEAEPVIMQDEFWWDRYHLTFNL